MEMRLPKIRKPVERVVIKAVRYPDGMGGSFVVMFCPLCLANIMEDNYQSHLEWHIRNGEDVNINEDD